jgi:hypothetical protein
MEQIWYTGGSGQDRREQKTYFGMKTGRNLILGFSSSDSGSDSLDYRRITF